MTHQEIDKSYAQSLPDILKLIEYIIEVYGNDIYLDKDKLSHLILELATFDEAEVNTYREAIIKHNISVEIYKSVSYEIEHSASFVNSHITSIIELSKITETFSEEKSREIIKNLTKPLALNTTLGYTLDQEHSSLIRVLYSLNGKRLERVSSGYGNHLAIKEGTEVICNEAFFSAYDLGMIEIPASLTKIGRRPFKDARSIHRIYVSPQNNRFISVDGVLIDKISNELIASFPLHYKTHYKIPDNIVTINEAAFYLNENLKYLSIPESVAHIGIDAFTWCTNLKYVELSPSNPNYSFKDGAIYSKDFKKLLHVIPGYDIKVFEIPDTVTYIGATAFSTCKNIKKINIPESVVEIGDRAFSSSGIQEIEIPGSVTTIGKHLFNGAVWLQKVKLPNTIKTIPDFMFYNCNSLKEIDIPDSVEIIDFCAFDYCENLEKVNLSKSLKIIGISAFDCCFSLSHIDLPPSLEYIDMRAFGSCPLTYVRISKNTIFNGGISGIYLDDENLEIVYY